MGLNDVPKAGQRFTIVRSEKEARNMVAERIAEQKSTDVVVPESNVTLEKLFSQFQAGEIPELRLIVKADVQGSLEPIVSSLNDLKIEDISVNILPCRNRQYW